MNSLAAVILAAGLSSRMGSFKPLLPLGGGTVLSRCVETFRRNGVDQIFVVTGRRHVEVAEAALRCGATPVHNADFEQGMYSSVLTGVRAMPDSIRGFAVTPVDIPLVREATVSRMIHVYDEQRPMILYPRFMGERGHPPFLSPDVLPDILAHDGTGGLRTVLERHDEAAVDCDVADFGTVHDLDHPADYTLALSLVDAGAPTDDECRQLWNMYETPPEIIAHCQAVATVAEALCEHCACGVLDRSLVRGAALTHDIGKGTKRHEAAGAERLHAHGFHVAAEIAFEHFDLTLDPQEPITEKEIVFLADKLVKEQSPVDLEERYLEKIALFGHEPGAADAIQGRLRRAKKLMDRFDAENGKSAQQLAYEVLA